MRVIMHFVHFSARLPTGVLHGRFCLSPLRPVTGRSSANVE
ncbi:hypothetical protein JMJ77_0003082, partial [Colletotrichum scovillei]